MCLLFVWVFFYLLSLDDVVFILSLNVQNKIIHFEVIFNLTFIVNIENEDTRRHYTTNWAFPWQLTASQIYR